MADSVPCASFTAEVAGTVHAMTLVNLPERVIERSRHALLDWMACALAGYDDGVARIGRDVVQSGGIEFPATIIGTKLRASARDAAFANALAAHALDFDSSTPWAWGHPVVPLVSAALSLAEERNSSGAAMIEALVAGFEAAAVLGSATATGLSTRGFHRTGTIGVFAAAAASGKLTGMGPRDLQKVFSLAATQAAGLKLVLSTMGKSLNAARAAEAGILATQLVEKGFTAPDDAIENEFGYAAAFEGFLDRGRPREIMQGRYGIENNIIKFHACCHAAHSAIEGIRMLRSEHGVTGDDVASIALRVPASAMSYCGIMEPRNPAESMFSFPHAAALAALGESTGPEGFTAARIFAPEILAMRKRVEVIPDAEAGHGSVPTRVRITLRSGMMLEACVSVFGEMSEHSLRAQRAQIEEKFLDSAVPLLGKAKAERVLEVVADIVELPSMRELTRLLSIP
ncbi:MAG: MmgE/PrpD family protein [Gammaproteobacteria bacterium]